MTEKNGNGNWTGMGPRVVIWGLGVCVMALTAFANLKTVQAQAQFREEMDKRLTGYITRDQWQERWDGHNKDQNHLETLLLSLEASIKQFNLTSSKLSERMVRLEATIEASRTPITMP